MSISKKNSFHKMRKSVSNGIKESIKIIVPQ